MMVTNPVQTLYTQKAKLYQFFFVDLLQWGKVLESFFQENADMRPGMRILDAGCGTGIVTRVLYGLAQRKGVDHIHFHAFDLTPAMLDLFRLWIHKEGVKDIQLQQANVLDLENQLPSDWKDFDWIVSSAMLEYIPQESRQMALKNLKGLLNENGHILLFVTKRTWITRWTGTRWWGTNLFDRDELEAELLQAGYVSIRYKRMPKDWDTFLMAVEARACLRT